MNAAVVTSVRKKATGGTSVRKKATQDKAVTSERKRNSNKQEQRPARPDSSKRGLSAENKAGEKAVPAEKDLAARKAELVKYLKEHPHEPISERPDVNAGVGPAKPSSKEGPAHEANLNTSLAPAKKHPTELQPAIFPSDKLNPSPTTPVRTKPSLDKGNAISPKVNAIPASVRTKASHDKVNAIPASVRTKASHDKVNPVPASVRTKASHDKGVLSMRPKMNHPKVPNIGATNIGAAVPTVTGTEMGSEIMLARPTKKTPKKKPPEVVREELSHGHIVENSPYRWKVMKLLGSGGFGDVYKVTADGKKYYAMKTEMNEGEKRFMRLKVEVTVLQICHASKKKHFVEMMDRGKNDKFKFVVMSLVGPSLEDIRRQYTSSTRFSKSTVIQVAIQTIESIADLHELGWIHRDIKPANFAVGLGDRETTIYMLDFGIAKPIFTPNTKMLKKPRIRVKFLGTQRFASRNCHKGRDQGRHDDIETWIYMVFDLMDEEYALCWRRVEKDKVVELKESFFKLENKKMFKRVPKEFGQIITYVGGLRYESAVDYTYITKTLLYIADYCKIDLAEKLDWIGRLKTVKFGEQKSSITETDMRQSGFDESTSNSEQRIIGQ